MGTRAKRALLSMALVASLARGAVGAAKIPAAVLRTVEDLHGRCLAAAGSRDFQAVKACCGHLGKLATAHPRSQRITEAYATSINLCAPLYAVAGDVKTVEGCVRETGKFARRFPRSDGCRHAHAGLLALAYTCLRRMCPGEARALRYRHDLERLMKERPEDGMVVGFYAIVLGEDLGPARDAEARPEARLLAYDRVLIHLKGLSRRCPTEVVAALLARTLEETVRHLASFAGGDGKGAVDLGRLRRRVEEVVALFHGRPDSALVAEPCAGALAVAHSVFSSRQLRHQAREYERTLEDLAARHPTNARVAAELRLVREGKASPRREGAVQGP